MSHLKCKLHDRRVMVLDGRAFHRSIIPGEVSNSCDTKAVISDKQVYPVSSPHFHSSKMANAES